MAAPSKNATLTKTIPVKPKAPTVEISPLRPSDTHLNKGARTSTLQPKHLCLSEPVANEAAVAEEDNYEDGGEGDFQEPFHELPDDEDKGTGQSLY